MTRKYSAFARAFGIAAFFVVGLSGCDQLQSSIKEAMPDEDINAAIGFVAVTALNGAITFDRQMVRSEMETGQAGDGTKYLTSVTYDIFRHQLCHSRLTEDDQTKPVCHEGKDFTDAQNLAMRDALCLAAEVKSNRVYRQIFCAPVSMT